MDATPISFDSAAPFGFAPDSGSTAARWSAVTDAARVVAALAGLSDQDLAAEPGGFLAALGVAPRWRRDLAEQGVEDIAAIMEPGLAALIAVHRAGGDASVPARALWWEFAASRDALQALAQSWN